MSEKISSNVKPGSFLNNSKIRQITSADHDAAALLSSGTPGCVQEALLARAHGVQQGIYAVSSQKYS